MRNAGLKLTTGTDGVISDERDGGMDGGLAKGELALSLAEIIDKDWNCG